MPNFHCHAARPTVNRITAARPLKTPGPYRLFGYSALYHSRALTRSRVSPKLEFAFRTSTELSRARNAAKIAQLLLQMSLRSALRTLLVLALALPVAQCVLIWVRGLLSSMGDQDGSVIIGHVGTACQVVWSISLVGLVIVLAFVALDDRSTGE